MNQPKGTPGTATLSTPVSVLVPVPVPVLFYGQPAAQGTQPAANPIGLHGAVFGIPPIPVPEEPVGGLEVPPPALQGTQPAANPIGLHGAVFGIPLIPEPKGWVPMEPPVEPQGTQPAAIPIGLHCGMGAQALLSVSRYLYNII